MLSVKSKITFTAIFKTRPLCIKQNFKVIYFNGKILDRFLSYFFGPHNIFFNPHKFVLMIKKL